MSFEDKHLASLVAACAVGVGIGVVLVHTFGRVEPASRAFDQPAVVAPASASPATPVAPEIGSHVVTDVVSSEVVTLEGVGKVRLLGVDTLHGPGGKDADPAAAKAYLTMKIKGKEVFATGDPETADTEFKDENGAPLVYLMLEDGVIVNTEMIARGMAITDLDRSYGRRDELMRAERDARWNNRGVWDIAALKPLSPSDLDKANAQKKNQLPPVEVPPPAVGKNDVLVTSDGRFHRSSCKLGKGGVVMSIDDARKKHYLACPSCFASPRVKV
ncbi:MAG TPA: thermonuclease family protein [Blastocatellia bacterium]|nr:thermonuclease family protein [Blastocatellia bacterium]